MSFLRSAAGSNGFTFAGRLERLDREEKNLRRMPRDIRVHWIKQEQQRARASVGTRSTEQRSGVLGARSTLAHAGKALMDNVLPQGQYPMADPASPRGGRLRSKERLEKLNPGVAVYPAVDGILGEIQSDNKEREKKKGEEEKKANMKKALAEKKALLKQAQESSEPGLCQVAMELNIPLDDTRAARELFDRHDTVQRGVLTKTEFRACVAEMVNSIEALDQMVHDAWLQADSDRSGDIDFREFAKWYSKSAFVEDVLLDPEQAAVRDLSRKYDLSLVDIEKIKKEFSRYDEDGSGEIEYDEFVKLLYKLLKVPPHLTMPASRVNNFWLEIDQDGSGSVDFEEFLVWYLKYFGCGDESSGSSPLEDFYNVRRFSVQ